MAMELRTKARVLRAFAVLFIVLFLSWGIVVASLFLNPTGWAAAILGRYEGLGPSMEIQARLLYVWLVLSLPACTFWLLAMRSNRNRSSQKK